MDYNINKLCSFSSKCLISLVLQHYSKSSSLPSTPMIPKVVSLASPLLKIRSYNNERNRDSRTLLYSVIVLLHNIKVQLYHNFDNNTMVICITPPQSILHLDHGNHSPLHNDPKTICICSVNYILILPLFVNKIGKGTRTGS